MKAVILRQPQQLELVEIPRPRLTEENHVLVQVRACGICGSDLRYFMGENPWALHTLGRHVDNPPDMILRHRRRRQQRHQRLTMRGLLMTRV